MFTDLNARVDTERLLHGDLEEAVALRGQLNLLAKKFMLI